MVSMERMGKSQRLQTVMAIYFLTCNSAILTLSKLLMFGKMKEIFLFALA